ncbi:hypothetical protein BSIN_2230 [Burkholderia singularis]|uniref:Uncharacterized protein n=1 Tax=Burkholderia singularis TaxID=1503053 RepID=A0A238H1J2_9BURK|nr:hypothetical protein BSIN_2230 [Burkholderia singularis]
MPLRSFAALFCLSARDARSIPQQANLRAVIAATAAGRQMDMHAEPLVERQRSIELIGQKPCDVLTFPQ